jgi:hypothetical protein
MPVILIFGFAVFTAPIPKYRGAWKWTEKIVGSGSGTGGRKKNLTTETLKALSAPLGYARRVGISQPPYSAVMLTKVSISQCAMTRGC